MYGASYPDTVKILKMNKKFKIEGFIDDVKYGKDKTFMGEKILGNVGTIDKYVNENFNFVNNVFNPIKKREKIHKILQQHDAKIVSVIHPNVDTSLSCIGKSVWIHDGVKIGANAQIGNNVVIRFNSIINHDNVIEDFVFISPGVVLAGRVRIKRNTFIGSGAVVLPNKTIGENSIVGAGSVVIKDIPDNCTYAGNPARELKGYL